MSAVLNQAMKFRAADAAEDGISERRRERAA